MRVKTVGGLHRLVAAAVAVIVAAGCGSTPPVPTASSMVSVPPASRARTPTATPTPRPTATRRAEPTPEPTPPAGLARNVTIEEDGLRISITVDRNPMPAGEVTGVTYRVRNVGRTSVSWGSDGCESPVGLYGEMTGIRLRPGAQATGDGSRFKFLALDDVEDGIIRIGFVPEPRLGKGTYGCGDIHMGHEIEPGQQITRREFWDGAVATRHGLPPTGAIRLTGWAGDFSRRHDGQDVPIGDDGVLKPVLDAWISAGHDPAWLDLPEVVDAALADPQLQAWLGKVEIGNASEPVAWWDAEQGLWQVGILRYYVQPGLWLVLVDPLTGAVTGHVERDWDPDVDGFP